MTWLAKGVRGKAMYGNFIPSSVYIIVHGRSLTGRLIGSLFQKSNFLGWDVAFEAADLVCIVESFGGIRGGESVTTLLTLVFSNFFAFFGQSLVIWPGSLQ